MALLNYHHLRIFRAIAHQGNLTRAAEQLNLSQSALSVQLGKLEAQVGIRCSSGRASGCC
jgi:LysR family transcriptional activator of nhaA